MNAKKDFVTKEGIQDADERGERGSISSSYRKGAK
jgi:hypothetical protein